MLSLSTRAPKLASLLDLNSVERSMQLAALNNMLEQLPAIERIRWGMENLEGNHVLSSSFGLQSAVMLHLVTSVEPSIPIVLTDTGYLFRETYQFIDQLEQSMDLNVKVYLANQSPQWQEARYGKLWEQGIDGITRYNEINKVEPMRRALRGLAVGTWFSGLRREQSSSRNALPILSIQNKVFKFLPIVDWSESAVASYMDQKQLPYHPLSNLGYVSIGDTHTTAKWQSGMKHEETRFFGLKRECGLHEDDEADGSGI